MTLSAGTIATQRKMASNQCPYRQQRPTRMGSPAAAIVTTGPACDQVARLVLTDQMADRANNLDRRERYTADYGGECPLGVSTTSSHQPLLFG